MALPKIEIDDFKHGMVTEGADGTLPFSAQRRIQNLRVDDFGALDLIGGQANLIATRPNPVVSFLRYTDPEDTSYRRLIVAEKSGAGPAFTYTINAINESSGAVTLLGSAISYTDPYIFQVGRAVFIPQSNASFIYWPGPTFAFATVGVSPPAVTPTLALNAGGTELNSTNGTPYRYTITNFDQFGNESNPTTVAGVFTPSAPISTLAGGSRIVVTIPADPSAPTKHGIYRIGGKLTTWRKVAEVNYTGAVINYTDSIADLLLSLTNLNFNHDSSPGGFRIATLHKNRLWGAGIVFSLTGSPSRLWYSSAGNFQYWPRIQDGGPSDGGFLSLDDNPEDPLVWLSSLDNLLVVHRKNSVYLVYGDRPSNFVPVRRNVPGTIAGRSVARYENGNYRLTREATVAFFSPDGDTVISEQIDKRLKAVPKNLLPNAAGIYFDGEYHLHIPNPGGTPYTFVYNLSKKAWREASDANDKLNHAVEFRVFTGTSEQEEQLLFAPVSGYVDADGNAYNGVVQAETTATPNRVIELLTDNFNFGESDRLTSIDSIRVEGEIQAPGSAPVPQLTLTTTKKDNSTTVAKTNNLTLNSQVPHDREFPLDMIGIKHRIRIYGKVTVAHIRSIIIRYRILGPIKR